MKRFLYLLILFFVQCTAAPAQNPFDYANTKHMYFISAADIDSLHIKNIYSVSVLKKPGKLGQTADVSNIDLSDHYRTIRESWNVYKDTVRNYSLDSLLKLSTFVSRKYYLFENGYIKEAGVAGYGNICYRVYAHDTMNASCISKEMCRYSDRAAIQHISYHPNGLVNTVVYAEHTNEEFSNTQLAVAVKQDVKHTDTLTYVYDANWMVLGFYSKAHRNEYIPVFYGVLHSDITFDEKFYQTYVNKTTMEAFADTNIGYRPQVLLFEIYRNAVFTFLYDSKRKKYFQTRVVSIE